MKANVRRGTQRRRDLIRRIEAERDFTVAAGRRLEEIGKW
jgi:hypothetical protein